ncbi:MAG: BON domain-containing protein, partial [Planctomycetaceae bacterium]|jgi:hypothetical protein|nr:BON domain-containing protein [Planctomycetaceae bacterium]
MRRLVVISSLACIAMWLSEPQALAQSGSQNQPSRTTTSSSGTTSTGVGTTGVGTSSQSGSARPDFNLGFNAQGTSSNFGSGFVGNQNQGRFVGSQFAGQQNLSSGTSGRNTFGRSSGRGGRSSGRGRTNTRPGQGRNSRTAKVRPRFRVAFSLRPRTVTAVQASLDARFIEVVTQRQSLKAVSVAVGLKGELTLKGQVPDDSARRLAVNLVRMEPGVRKVINEITIAAAESATPDEN